MDRFFIREGTGHQNQNQKQKQQQTKSSYDYSSRGKADLEGKDNNNINSNNAGSSNNVERMMNLNAESLSVVHNNRQKHLPIHKQRELLPIFRYKTSILYLLEKYQTLVLVGGKKLMFLDDS